MEKIRRDRKLLDFMEAKPATKYVGALWRVVREGRNPLDCNASGGRWDDGRFDVLYTAMERETALAEMRFHLAKGQPVIPSKPIYKLYELAADLSGLLDLSQREDLEELGLDMSKFGQLSYEVRTAEYPSTQAIAETAHFLDFSGLIVPSARHESNNVVIFCDRIDINTIHANPKNHGINFQKTPQ